MRSELVTRAVPLAPNRFLLMHAACKVTRAFHRPDRDRVQQSINDALSGLGSGEFVLWPDTGFVTLGGRALIESHLNSPSEDTSSLVAFVSLSTGLPYFPPESVRPAEAEAAAETA